MDELRPSRLSRAQLESFLGKNEPLIRFFEQLIKIGQQTPDGIDTVTIIAETAQDTADSAAAQAGIAAVIANIALDLVRGIDAGPTVGPALQAQLHVLAARVAALEERPL